jgi:hypothetical protein
MTKLRRSTLRKRIWQTKSRNISMSSKSCMINWKKWLLEAYQTPMLGPTILNFIRIWLWLIVLRNQKRIKRNQTKKSTWIWSYLRNRLIYWQLSKIMTHSSNHHHKVSRKKPRLKGLGKAELKLLLSATLSNQWMLPILNHKCVRNSQSQLRMFLKRDNELENQIRNKLKRFNPKFL